MYHYIVREIKNLNGNEFKNYSKIDNKQTVKLTKHNGYRMSMLLGLSTQLESWTLDSLTIIG